MGETGGIGVAVIVVSDAVYEGRRRDVSGEKAARLFEEAGYRVVYRSVVPNNPRHIYGAVHEAAAKAGFILAIGGTGPSPRDITVDVVEKLAWRHLPGFGELFRRLTYEREGVKAIYTRAELYLVSSTPVAVIPGAPGAVELALKEILLDAIPHLVEEAARIEGPHGGRGGH